MSATGGAAAAVVADILPPGAFLLGRATINGGGGGVQAVGSCGAGDLPNELGHNDLVLCSAGASAGALVLVALGIGDHVARAVSRSPVRRARTVNGALL